MAERALMASKRKYLKHIAVMSACFFTAACGFLTAGIIQGSAVMLVLFAVAASVSALLLIFMLRIRYTAMIITDKRIYGKASFGKVSNIPLESVSEVVSKPFGTVIIHSEYGKTVFTGLSNRDELADCIKRLIN